MDTQLDFDWDAENEKQTMYFGFSITTSHKAVSGNAGKITRKETLTLFFWDSPEIDNETSIGKNDFEKMRLWLL